MIIKGRVELWRSTSVLEDRRGKDILKRQKSSEGEPKLSTLRNICHERHGDQQHTMLQGD